MAGGLGGGKAFENGGQQTDKVDRLVSRGLKDSRPLLGLPSGVRIVLKICRGEDFCNRMRHGLPEKRHGSMVLRVPLGEQIDKVKRKILVQR